MRAIVCRQFGRPSELKVEDWPAPVAGPGQVVVTIKAAGMNYPDALQVQGRHQNVLQPPFIPGSELAGVVKAVGPGVSHLQVGQRVFATRLRGAFAEEIALDAAHVRPLPATLGFEEAAGLSVTYNTSYCALVSQAALKPGETVLVLGAAGGVGLSAIEIAKACGARVIAAASTDDKLAVCAQAGADHLVNYTAPDWRNQVKAITGAAGVDVVYDPVGGRYAEPAVRSMGWRGRYLVIGFADGEIPKIALNLVLLKSASIIGVFLGEVAVREPQVYRDIEAGVLALAEAGKIKPLVSRRYSLERAGEGLEALLNRQAVGKLVLVP